MLKINASLRAYDSRTLKLCESKDTFNELRGTFSYMKDKKIPVTIERVSEHCILLGAYFEEGETYIRISLEDAKID